MKKILIIFILVLLSGINFRALSSHIIGGNISYECVGPNQYLVTLTMLEDCSTAFEANTNQNIIITNSCGYVFPANLTVNNTLYQQEVSQICDQDSSTCSGGTLPGVWMHQWQGMIQLPGTCDSWVISYSSCCRNNAVNSTTYDSYYWETVINSQTIPCNSSSVSNGSPVPNFCINQPAVYNLNLSDSDGNILSYSLVSASAASSTSITYAGGYSGSQPINGVTIDPINGNILFTPTVLGNFIFAVKVEEKDSTGNIAGIVVYDFQVNVVNCVNNLPDSPDISNYSGSALEVDSRTIAGCSGTTFCFDLVFTDSDISDSLSVNTNLFSIFPGASMNISGYNPLTVSICDTITSGIPLNNLIYFEIIDSRCPFPGINSSTITINRIEGTYAGDDEFICLGQSQQLSANGGTSFQWSVLSGDPIVNGVNFSCDTCQFPVSSPDSTTTYVLTSNLPGACAVTDTITVFVSADFSFSIIASQNSTCFGDTIQLTTTTSVPANYYYDWSPQQFLTTENTPDTDVYAVGPDSITVFLNITIENGCTKTDSIILVFNGSPFIENISAGPDSVFCGNSTQLMVNFYGIVSNSCGPVTQNCTSTTPITIGIMNGSNTTTTFPSPYSNWYANTKHQFLFKADELNNAGFYGGIINEIGWEILQINGITIYPDYTIRIGCTESEFLTTVFESGLTTTFGPEDVEIFSGMNTHTFQTPFDWDGNSNLIVEVCYTWTAQYTYTTNSIVPLDNTSFVSSTWFNSDGTVACPATAAFGSSQTRPVTKFGYCTSAASPMQYNYSWTPSGNLNDSTIYNPVSTPDSSVIYTVFVTDSLTGCVDTASFNLTVECDCMPQVTNSTATCPGFCNGTADIQVNGADSSVTYLWCNNETGSSAVNLCEGNCWVYINDSVSCSGYYNVFINVADTINITETHINYTDASNPGSIDVSVSGGVPPYIFNWSNSETTEDISNLTPGTYLLSVTDSMGCTQNVTIVITIITSVNNYIIDSNPVIIPNPNNGQFEIKSDAGFNKIQIFSMDGKLVLSDSFSPLKNYFVNENKIENGVYFVKIYFGEQVIIKKITFTR